MEKTKHRFNIIDVIIILLILVTAALLVKIYIIDDAGDVTSKSAAVQFVVCTDTISEELSDNVAVGDKVFDYASGKEIGTVSACDVRNATYSGTSQSGATVVSEIAGSKTLYITVEASASVTDDAYRIGSLPVRVGEKYTFMLPHLYCTGSCISVELIG